MTATTATTAICGMVGTWAAGPDAGAHLDAMAAGLAGGGGGATATWCDPLGRCRLAIHGPIRPVRPGGVSGVVEEGALAAVCAGDVFSPPGPGCAGERLARRWLLDGPRGLHGVDGQFALAVWDGRTERLTLARDALGVRSIYFHPTRDGVVFASTIEALLCHPAVPREVAVGAVSQYLTFLNVPAPGTLFAGISKLPPGSLVVCGPHGVDRTARFWDLLDDPLPEIDDAGYYVDRVRRLHREAVAGRIVDGPMAALLSGGNDSSANVALMAKLGVAPLHTFTVGLAGYEGQDRYSDLVHARRVAELTGAVHHERLITVDEFIAAMPAVTAALDDLVAEPSAVFLHAALEMVRDRGLRVLLTGEGNDELSCGHGEMIRIRNGYYRRWRPLTRLPRSVRRLVAASAAVMSPRYADVLARAADDGEYFWSFELGWTDRDKPSILTGRAFEAARGVSAAAIVAERARGIRAKHVRDRDYLDHVIAAMMQDHYFGNLMLGKLELLSARLGVDARCPYTSPAYAHFVYNIPARFKTKGGVVKAFFKAAIRELLPDDIIHRPKQGFRTPTAELFRGPFGYWAEPILLDRGLTAAGILRRDALAGLLAAHRRGGVDLSTRLWTALVLNLWYERWIAGAQASAVTTSEPRRLASLGAPRRAPLGVP